MQPTWSRANDYTETYANMQKSEDPSGANLVTTYDYGSRGELRSVVLPDGSKVVYVHGPDGRRVAPLKYDSLGVLQPGETEKYLWGDLTT